MELNLKTYTTMRENINKVLIFQTIMHEHLKIWG